MNIGKNLKKCRKEKGLTQKQLAELIGVVASTVTKYENNQLEPNINTLMKISEALDVSMAELIGKEKESFTNFLSMLLSDVKDALEETHENEVKYRDFLRDYNDLLEKFNCGITTSYGLLGFILSYIGNKDKDKNREFPRISDEPGANTITLKEAEDIINKVCDLVEFELYKLKNNKE